MALRRLLAVALTSSVCVFADTPPATTATPAKLPGGPQGLCIPSGEGCRWRRRVSARFGFGTYSFGCQFPLAPSHV